MRQNLGSSNSITDPDPAGWAAAKLRTKASSVVSRVEVLPPVFGSVSRAVQRGTQKGTAKMPVRQFSAKAGAPVSEWAVHPRPGLYCS